MTTILCVRKNDSVVMAGDGQVFLKYSDEIHSDQIKEPTTEKSSLVLQDPLLMRLRYSRNLMRNWKNTVEKYFVLVELAKEWRTNKILRNLEAFY